MTNTPIPFEVHESGTLLHGTKAQLSVGELLVPGRMSNNEPGRVMNHVYVTETLDAAAWGAELAVGAGPARIYLVEPIGTLEDDPNVTNKRFPGNPTRSYRTREPVRIVGELQAGPATPPSRCRPCVTASPTSGSEAQRRSTTDSRSSAGRRSEPERSRLLTRCREDPERPGGRR